MPDADDLRLIELVLWALWAPQDVNPQRRAELINDTSADHLTINDVIRARRALERLQTKLASDEDRDD